MNKNQISNFIDIFQESERVKNCRHNKMRKNKKLHNSTHARFKNPKARNGATKVKKAVTMSDGLASIFKNRFEKL